MQRRPADVLTIDPSAVLAALHAERLEPLAKLSKLA